MQKMGAIIAMDTTHDSAHRCGLARRLHHAALRTAWSRVLGVARWRPGNSTSGARSALDETFLTLRKVGGAFAIDDEGIRFCTRRP